jgi:hypothetical protein
MTEKKAGGFTISTVADRYGIHPQTLRSYELEGLLRPSRSTGNATLHREGSRAAGIDPDPHSRTGGQPGRRGGGSPHALEDAANAR